MTFLFLEVKLSAVLFQFQENCHVDYFVSPFGFIPMELSKGKRFIFTL